MNLSWMSEYKGEMKTLKLTEDPMRYGLGNYKDIDDVLWHVNCVIGRQDHKPYICARPVDDSAYYSTAVDSNQNGFHSWKPYYFEVIKEKNMTPINEVFDTSEKLQINQIIEDAKSLKIRLVSKHDFENASNMRDLEKDYLKKLDELNNENR